MASKTVLKALLSKWGILSTEMQSAVRFDQSVVKSVENQEVEYIDNDPISEAFDEPVKAKKVEAEKLVK